MVSCSVVTGSIDDTVRRLWWWWFDVNYDGGVEVEDTETLEGS
ncbi:hypothetical protein Hanom_Chr07g00604691 [Helianthus anomalus]